MMEFSRERHIGSLCNVTTPRGREERWVVIRPEHFILSDAGESLGVGFSLDNAPIVKVRG